MGGETVVEVIPYEDFWEKIRIVAHYAYEMGAAVEIYDNYIYVEHRKEAEHGQEGAG